MIWLVLPIAALSFLFFGMSCDDHHLRRFGRRCSSHLRQRLRMAGWSGIALCFPTAVLLLGWAYGPVAWAGLTMLGAGAAFLLLNFAPAALRTRG